MVEIIGFIFEVALRGLGLWLLRVLTFGRHEDTNSYLYFLPTFVGFLTIALLLLLIFVIAAGLKVTAPT